MFGWQHSCICNPSKLILTLRYAPRLAHVEFGVLILSLGCM